MTSENDKFACPKLGNPFLFGANSLPVKVNEYAIADHCQSADLETPLGNEAVVGLEEVHQKITHLFRELIAYSPKKCTYVLLWTTRSVNHFGQN
ncbi:hypothetical protein Y032_0051g2160 [Ancylostoma ceylanicum]|uniref:Uncharacterized protein n=1 Tax=Ancylostoma ceylanicum TaxID=53326 RepID=A0A016U9R2_9BILA|nr:hypothetical protein Y032_0051g2160 [Ancylostoma ceylanicum]